MEKTIKISDDYLYIPVKPGAPEQLIRFYVTDEAGKRQLYIFKIPVDPAAGPAYDAAYYGEIPVKDLRGKTLTLEGEMTEGFAGAVVCGAKRKPVTEKRPAVHFTPDAGWINDPNGLIFADGLYHAYFQYNPFNITWANMSWGHAVSRDLLHWEQLDSVLFPDADGAAFSGSGVKNERGLLGLPDDALLFFYTRAGGEDAWSEGKQFAQFFAWSEDGGRTLKKKEGAFLEGPYRDSRDPKVTWHECFGAYIMTLWLRGNEFGIYRSADLENWEQTQTVTLEGGFECPDLLHLTGENGEDCWFFWSADGTYFPGTFDGRTFRQIEGSHKAYISKLPYAAQGWTGIEGRTVTVPWLRTDNDGRLFTGLYGIPTELTFREKNGQHLLIQKPVRELFEHASAIPSEEWKAFDSSIRYIPEDGNHAFFARMQMKPAGSADYVWSVNGSLITYNAQSGTLWCDRNKFQIGTDRRDVLMVVDDTLLEIFFDGGEKVCTVTLAHGGAEFYTDAARIEKIELERIQ